ncbi:YciI family protein [Luteipulveratus sp. YIM 133132]|uniref:YciI family protein n=1 Tax=Luteipulveratus flavus TaxID=3031728 RepID=A0ABT6CAZ4_9MICO|nr:MULTISPECIES: YciI family protein [unclassified Luteipulveratus]MDE9366603.1 YciI family protein [Luteipulveratus sp. YIM 133132]MDF8266056.1 YciI family protein [Luteipulveratus sp. YIM 133296]
MTQYMISVMATEGEPQPSGAEMQRSFRDVETFNEKLRKNGHWVFAGGMHEPSTATVVDGTGTDVVTTDGPFSESKEYIGGFWVIEATDLDAALRLAAEGSKACGGKVEVRPFHDEADIEDMVREADARA